MPHDAPKPTSKSRADSFAANKLAAETQAVIDKIEQDLRFFHVPGRILVAFCDASTDRAAIELAAQAYRRRGWKVQYDHRGYDEVDWVILLYQGEVR